VKKKVPPASRDMLATEDTDEDEDDDDEEEAFKTPRVVNKKHSAVASAVAAMPPLGGGTGSAANVRKRSPNFSEVEDAYITKAWCSATEDSRKGSGQKAQDFNKNLYSKFVSLADDYNGQVTKQFQIPMKARTQKAIVDRFAKIKRATSHFAGVVSRNKIKSGEDKETHIRRCLLVYDQTHKGKFTWLECYEILEHLPKWNAQNDAGDSKPVAASVSSQGTKRKNRSRSTGKRQKALSDKIDRMLDKHNASGPTATGGDRLSVVGGTLNQMTSHMVEQLNFAHWNDEDKALYFAQDAQEKALQQKKRIILLENELAELQRFKVPTLNNGEGYDEEDDEE
jgi:hypothetical protein